MESVGVEPTPSDFQSDAITVSANFPNSFTASCQPCLVNIIVLIYYCELAVYQRDSFNFSVNKPDVAQ